MSKLRFKMCILLYVNYSHNVVKNNKTQDHQSNQCVAVRYFVKTCKKINPGTSWWSRAKKLCAPNTWGPGLIPVWGARSYMQLKIPQAATNSFHAATKDPIIHDATKDHLYGY